MDERNSSRSSSSITGHIVSEVSDAQNVAGQEKDETATCLEKQYSPQTQASHITFPSPISRYFMFIYMSKVEPEKNQL